MADPNPDTTVTFTVTPKSDGTGFDLTCDKSDLTVKKNLGGTVLTFNLSQNSCSGWRFPAVAEAQANEDYYFGITIFSDQGSEFHNCHRSSDGQTVTIGDRNDSQTRYTYSATIENPYSKQTLTSDPTISNQT